MAKGGPLSVDQNTKSRFFAWAPLLALPCFVLYLGTREGDVAAFWLVILLRQTVGTAKSFDALSLSVGHISVSVGFVLLDAAVGVIMGRLLVI